VPGPLPKGPVEIGGTSRLDELKAHPSARPATSARFSMSFSVRSGASPESRRTATRLTPGTAWELFQTLAYQVHGEVDNPVTLPPGCARLVTSPLATGSPELTKTMGMVLVACLAARTCH